MAADRLSDLKRSSERSDPPLVEDDADKQFEMTLGDNPCCSRPSPKPLHGLRIERKGKRAQVVEYFGIDGKGDNTCMVFITGGHRIWQITVTGRNLLRLLNYIKEHRMDWIKEADRDGFRDKELYIASISPKLISLEKLAEMEEKDE